MNNKSTFQVVELRYNTDNQKWIPVKIVKKNISSAKALAIRDKLSDKHDQSEGELRAYVVKPYKSNVLLNEIQL